MIAIVAQIPPEYFLPVVVMPTLFAFGRLVIVLRQKDRFLARIFSEHRDIWEALGGPRGWQWSPPRGARPPANSPSIYLDWFSADEPSWLLRASDLRADYRVVRAGIRWWNFVAMPIFIGAALLFFLLVKLTQ